MIKKIKRRLIIKRKLLFYIKQKKAPKNLTTRHMTWVMRISNRSVRMGDVWLAFCDLRNEGIVKLSDDKQCWFLVKNRSGNA